MIWMKINWNLKIKFNLRESVNSKFSKIPKGPSLFTKINNKPICIRALTRGHQVGLQGLYNSISLKWLIPRESVNLSSLRFQGGQVYLRRLKINQNV